MICYAGQLSHTSTRVGSDEVQTLQIMRGRRDGCQRNLPTDSDRVGNWQDHILLLE